MTKPRPPPFLLLAFALSLTACKPPTTTPDAPHATPDTPQAIGAGEYFPAVPQAPQEGNSAKIVGVHDGDTIKALVDGKEESIRLEGIDAPELGQPFGKNAKAMMSDLVFGKLVTIKESGKPDRYGRKIARVFVGFVDVNKELVRQGYAWHFTTYSKEQALADAEREARSARRGFWVDREPMAPWDWRKS